MILLLQSRHSYNAFNSPASKSALNIINPGTHLTLKWESSQGITVLVTEGVLHLAFNDSIANTVL